MLYLRTIMYFACVGTENFLKITFRRLITLYTRLKSTYRLFQESFWQFKFPADKIIIRNLEIEDIILRILYVIMQMGTAL